MKSSTRPWWDAQIKVQLRLGKAPGSVTGNMSLIREDTENRAFRFPWSKSHTLTFAIFQQSL